MRLLIYLFSTGGSYPRASLILSKCFITKLHSWLKAYLSFFFLIDDDWVSVLWGDFSVNTCLQPAPQIKK